MSAARVLLAAFYTAEITSGIAHLHRNDIVWNDLKSENITVDKEGHVKLLDFGFASVGITSYDGNDGGLSSGVTGGTAYYYAPEAYGGLLNIGRYPAEFHELAHELAPPEGWSRNARVGKAVDWWALGCLLFEMLHMSTQTPFEPCMDGPGPMGTTVEFLEGVLKGWPGRRQEIRREEYPGLPADAISFMEELLNNNPTARLGTARRGEEVAAGTRRLMGHPFFTASLGPEFSWERLNTRVYRPPWRPVPKQIRRTGTVERAKGDIASTQQIDPRIVTAHPQLQGVCGAFGDLAGLCPIEHLNQ